MRKVSSIIIDFHRRWVSWMGQKRLREVIPRKAHSNLNIFRKIIVNAAKKLQFTEASQKLKFAEACCCAFVIVDWIWQFIFSKYFLRKSFIIISYLYRNDKSAVKTIFENTFWRLAQLS